jgi:hypothetical protein
LALLRRNSVAGRQTGCSGTSQSAGKDYVRCKTDVKSRPAESMQGGISQPSWSGVESSRLKELEKVLGDRWGNFPDKRPVKDGQSEAQLLSPPCIPTWHDCSLSWGQMKSKWF